MYGECDIFKWNVPQIEKIGMEGRVMSNISISNLTFSYDGSYENVFENVNFHLDSTWKLGLIGRNGRGKTTLLNLLMNKYNFSGSITSKVMFSYFPYEVTNPDENVIDLIGDDWRIYKELSLLSVSEEVLFRPFRTLSEGEKTKVMLATMFIKEHSFKLLDEPTNHLDSEGREILCQYLKKKQGFILVSHDRYFLDNTVDHIMSINKSNIEIVSGNFSSWNKNKEMTDLFELEQNAKIKNEIKRLSETASEKSTWSDKVEATKSRKLNPEALDKGYIGHQAAKMMKRSKAIERRIECQISKKEKLLQNIETADSLRVTPLSFHSKRLISGKDISISYDKNAVVTGLNFEILNGQKVHIQGKNGSGKSTLLKLILGENINYEGDYYKAKGLTLSYVSQDTTYLEGRLSEFEEKENLDVTLFRSILRKLDFSRDNFDKSLEDYSAGQKKKVLLAKSLSEKAHIYIWDEPLNYIDVLSRIQVEELIRSSNMTLIFVEHDRMFCENIADSTIVL